MTNKKKIQEALTQNHFNLDRNIKIELFYFIEQYLNRDKAWQSYKSEDKKRKDACTEAITALENLEKQSIISDIYANPFDATSISYNNLLKDLKSYQNSLSACLRMKSKPLDHWYIGKMVELLKDKGENTVGSLSIITELLTKSGEKSNLKTIETKYYNFKNLK